MSPTTPFSTLARALASGARPADLLPELHRELLAATGGVRSVVLEASGDPVTFAASSGRGFPQLGTVWLAGADAERLAALAASGARLTVLDAASGVGRLLDSDRALIVPVSFTRRPTVLIVANPNVPEVQAIEAAARAAIEFGIALEWSRLTREGSAQHRLRELALVFSRGISSAAGLLPALETVTHEANLLLGTERTSVWLHDRRARDLVLVASSDPAHIATAARMNVEALDPPARGLRLDRPQRIPGREAVLVAPLRGWRRALGTLVVEGEPSAIDPQQLVDLLRELARLISAGVENVQLVEEIVRQRRLLEDSFNSLADLVAVTDRELRVVQVNDTLVERIGRLRADIVEQELSDVMGPAIARWVAASEAEQPPSADSGPALVPGIPVRIRTFDDSPVAGVFSVTVTPLINDEDERTGFVVVARDVTAQSRLEAEREALRARLAQSEKLASLGQFVAGIAHEMNNPLQGILGHLELLLDHSEAARPVQRELRRIYQEAERTSRIVRNLLVFSGSRRMTRRKLRVDRLLQRALASRRVALARAGIEVVRSASEALPTVSGDPLLLQQAFLNILINAEHAIERSGSGGGRIEVTTTTNQAGQVVTTIRDSGVGIPVDVLPRIFDPFFTTKDVGKGTGLGLAITYGIVMEHGGTIQAANAVEGGAVFTVILPSVTTRRAGMANLSSSVT
jgi:signal transduction histidine kinase